MYKFVMDGNIYTINELAEKNGLEPATLRWRLSQGYSIQEAIKENPTHDSVIAFCNASYWRDWVGSRIDKVYEIYWKWCMLHDYEPLNKIAFARQIKKLFPIKTVANKNGRTIRVK